MSLQNIALFRGLGAKMNYLNQRQAVISTNIANSDTPGYQPKDLKKTDFGRILDSIQGVNSGVQRVNVATTAKGHMSLGGDVADPKAREAREVYEVAPAGNAVIMEEQMLNANQTMMDYTMMTSLLQKNVGMIKIALGR